MPEGRKLTRYTRFSNEKRVRVPPFSNEKRGIYHFL